MGSIPASLDRVGNKNGTRLSKDAVPFLSFSQPIRAAIQRDFIHESQLALDDFIQEDGHVRPVVIPEIADFGGKPHGIVVAQSFQRGLQGFSVEFAGRGCTPHAFGHDQAGNKAANEMRGARLVGGILQYGRHSGHVLAVDRSRLIAEGAFRGLACESGQTFVTSPDAGEERAFQAETSGCFEGFDSGRRETASPDEIGFSVSEGEHAARRIWGGQADGEFPDDLVAQFPGVATSCRDGGPAIGAVRIGQGKARGAVPVPIFRGNI